MCDPFTTEHQVIIDDASRMATAPDESIDLVVTSPPYPMIQQWDDQFGNASSAVHDALQLEDGQLAFELMHRELDRVWIQLMRVLKPGAIACINIGDATRSIKGHFQLFANHARITSKFLSLGFMQLPAILWRKPTNAPNKFMGSGMLPPGAYVTLEHEYILIFRKGGKRSFTEAVDKQARRESAYFWEERNTWFSDVWLDLRGTSQSMKAGNRHRRSGAFPLELPYRLINMFSVIGDTVLDPFLGTGTSVLAAMCSGRNSQGYEIDPDCRHAILEKMAAAPEAANAIIRQRLLAHRQFVQSRIEINDVPRHLNRYYGFPVVTQQETQLWLRPVRHVHYRSAENATVVYADRGRPFEQAFIDTAETASATHHPAYTASGKGRQLKLF